jgi:hypothetical protein
MSSSAPLQTAAQSHWRARANSRPDFSSARDSGAGAGASIPLAGYDTASFDPAFHPRARSIVRNHIHRKGVA